MDTPATSTRSLRIRGLVQGVGFRWALSDQAVRLGVSGWVRNRRDRSVEALLQGAPAAVDALIAWAETGPPAARVNSIDIEEIRDHELLTGFEQLPTL